MTSTPPLQEEQMPKDVPSCGRELDWVCGSSPPHSPSARHGPSRASLGTTLNPGPCPAPSPWKTHRQMQGPPALEPPSHKDLSVPRSQAQGDQKWAAGKGVAPGAGQGSSQCLHPTSQPHQVLYKLAWSESVERDCAATCAKK